MIAVRTLRAIKSVAVLVAAWLALVAALAVMSTAEQRSFWAAFMYWLWTLPLVLATWFLAETAGTWLLSRPFFERMSGPARVSALVVGVIVCVGIAVAAVNLWRAYAL